MYHRRLINPFLHFILSKCIKYEIVSWMVLRDTFGNTGTNLHTTILHTNALQALLKTLWRKQDSFLPHQTLALQAVFVLTYLKQSLSKLSLHANEEAWSLWEMGYMHQFWRRIYHRCQNLEY